MLVKHIYTRVSRLGCLFYRSSYSLGELLSLLWSLFLLIGKNDRCTVPNKYCRMPWIFNQSVWKHSDDELDSASASRSSYFFCQKCVHLCERVWIARKYVVY